MDTVYLDDNYGDYVRIEGVCYQLVGQDSNMPDIVGSPEGMGYADCLECAESPIHSSSSLSSSSSSSSSNGPAFGFLTGGAFTLVDGGEFEFIS